MKEKIVKNKIVDNVYDFLFLIYMVLKPIYIFSSGKPQISDFVIMILFFLLLITKKQNSSIDLKSNKIYKKINNFIFIIIWIITINIINFITYSSFDFISPILFYTFNYISMWCIYIYYIMYNDKAISKIVNYVCFSVIIQGILSIIFGLSLQRESLFFNNPNQLGLYALLCATIILLFKNRVLSREILILSLVFSTYMAIISLSKAAMIGILVLLLLHFIFYFKNKVIKIFIVLILVLVFSFGYNNKIMSIISNNYYVSTAIKRIENMSKENDTDLGSGRGYDRIQEIGINVIWGVGEGRNDRFLSLTGMEIHSAYASVLCYYGIIGVVILLFFIVNILPFNKKYIISLSGLFLYGITHQMLRNTMIWMLLCLICFDYYNQKEKGNEV